MKMTNKVILFLIRKKLGLKKWEKFRFSNQANVRDYYYFSNTQVVKAKYSNKSPNFFIRKPSNVSLNWLLNEQCKIIKVQTAKTGE